MKKVSIPLIILLVFSLVLTGCGSKAAPTPSPTPAAQTPKSGGTLKIAVLEPTILGFPSTMTGSSDGSISSVALETLFVFDKQNVVKPLLATAWKEDPAAKTLTINLNKGIKFHDGTEFNAEAVKWNLETYNTGRKPELKKMTSVDVVDPYTVRLNFSVYDNTIITQLANGGDAGRMISPTAFKKNGQAWAEQNPVGTGPFQFVSRTKDVSIKWKRFDEYWGGKPYLDGIDMLRYADPTVALMDFKAGNVDMISNLDPKDAKALEETGKFNVAKSSDGQNPALAGFANDPNSPFAKLEVRQALSYALDVETLAKTFGLGYYSVVNQWTIPGTWGYNPNVVGYPYNPKKAKELLAAAGYPNGFDTTLNFFNKTADVLDESTAIQKMLKEVGINAKLNPMLRPAFALAASNGKGWDGIIRMQRYSSPDPLVSYSYVNAGQEFAGIYLPDEFKSVYAQGASAVTLEGKQKLVYQMMSLATDKYSMASFLYIQPLLTAKSKRVHDDMYGELPKQYLSPKTWIGE